MLSLKRTEKLERARKFSKHLRKNSSFEPENQVFSNKSFSSHLKKTNWSFESFNKAMNKNMYVNLYRY